MEMLSDYRHADNESYSNLDLLCRLLQESNLARERIRMAMPIHIQQRTLVIITIIRQPARSLRPGRGCVTPKAHACSLEICGRRLLINPENSAQPVKEEVDISAYVALEAQ
ncbi:hypothetical protein EVAR_73501_1 [Eumeta japonica]|uniref:Uncharacterized protein n=1 Tax=Eumeta variegata TaxID=151549 RepID=A0A4C1T221_EUMVA|nr:hypothetical protein EVAR_73501_1 [Eumeta japonica]